MQLTDEFKHGFKIKNPIDFRLHGVQKVGMYSVEIGGSRVRLRYKNEGNLVSSYSRTTLTTKEIKRKIYLRIFKKMEE